MKRVMERDKEIKHPFITTPGLTVHMFNDQEDERPTENIICPCDFFPQANRQKVSLVHYCFKET